MRLHCCSGHQGVACFAHHQIDSSPNRALAGAGVGRGQGLAKKLTKAGGGRAQVLARKLMEAGIGRGQSVPLS